MGRKIKYNDIGHIRNRQAARRSRRRCAIHQFGKHHRIGKMSARDIDQFDREKVAREKLTKLKKIPKEKYLTPIQVSRRLKIPVQKVYKLLKSKKIKAERTFIRSYLHYIGDRWLIPETSIQEYKQSKRV